MQKEKVAHKLIVCAQLCHMITTFGFTFNMSVLNTTLPCH